MEVLQVPVGEQPVRIVRNVKAEKVRSPVCQGRRVGKHSDLRLGKCRIFLGIVLFAVRS